MDDREGVIRALTRGGIGMLTTLRWLRSVSTSLPKGHRTRIDASVSLRNGDEPVCTIANVCIRLGLFNKVELFGAENGSSLRP